MFSDSLYNIETEMRKGSAVVEEPNEEDEMLRQEFEEFGETVTEKITDKNRPILIKKLNHLKARQRMSEKLSQSILKESPKKAAKRGRGRKGKSVKPEPEPFHEATVDDGVNTGSAWEQLNETYNVSDTSPDGQPPAKQRRNIPPADSIPYAKEGPYAVARKRVAAMSQTADKTCDPPQSGTTNAAALNNSLAAKPLSLPASKGMQRRGRTRSVGDFGVAANTARLVSTEMDSDDGNVVQETSLPTKRTAHISVLPSAGTISSIPEETVREITSSSVLATDTKVASPRAGERDGHNTSRDGKHKASELSKSFDVGKQSAASRIPKLARFPSPTSTAQQVSHLQVYTKH